MGLVGWIDRKTVSSVTLKNGWTLTFSKPLSVWDAMAELTKAELELEEIAAKHPETVGVA